MKPITESLAAIAADWPALLADTYVLPATMGSGMPGGSSEAALPGGGQRLSLIAEIRHTLWHWCRIVLEKRAADTLLNHRVEADDVVAMCAWLRPHSDWMEGRNAISPIRWEQQEDAAEELDDLAGTIYALVHPTGALRPEIGPCQAADCPGTIRGYIDSDHLDGADLVCDADPDHRWERGRWVDLSRTLGHDYDERMSTDDLADYLTWRTGRRISADNLHKWTSRYRIGLWRGSDGLWDRIAITSWYIGWQAEKVGA